MDVEKMVAEYKKHFTKNDFLSEFRKGMEGVAERNPNVAEIARGVAARLHYTSPCEDVAAIDSELLEIQDILEGEARRKRNWGDLRLVAGFRTLLPHMFEVIL